MTEERTPHRSMGPPIELVKPKNVREKDTERDPNESVLGKLLQKQLISECEVAAGLEYHKHLVKSATGYSVPFVGRIPGQADRDADVMQCEAVLWLEKTNRDIMRRNAKEGRQFVTVLALALHPHSHMNLSEIDAAMKLPERKMRGRALLIDALGEIAEILGYVSTDKKHTRYG